MFELDPHTEYCSICGSNRLISFKARASDSRDSWVSITECKTCSFAWQHPAGRTTQQSAAWYEEAYRNAGQTGSDYFSPSRKQKIAELEFGFVSELPTSRFRRLLDIGAGTATFARLAADNGWTVTAVDPSLNVEQINRPNMTGFKGGLEHIPKGKLYDVITMWDVIEHVETPGELIRAATELLDDQGWLVIETGNYKSAARVLGGIDHWIYQLDHRWYFSPDSMMKMLKEFEFTEFVHCSKALRPGWTGDQDYAGPSRFQLIQSIISRPLQFKSTVSTHLQLLFAKQWRMAGIEVFTLAARKSLSRSDTTRNRI